MHKNYDLLVVGGGILGTFHAYAALRKGLKVALCERHTAPQSATVRNFGQVVPSGMNVKWQSIGRKSLAIYKEIQGYTDISLRSEGSIYIAHDEIEEQILGELAAINRANGYRSLLLTQAQCLERYPGLQSTYCRVGLFFPDEISLDPRVAVHKVRNHLIQQHGLVYFPLTTIREIESDGSTCVTVDHLGKKRTASQVVVCAGNEFEALFPEIYHNAGLEISQLQMMTTVPQPRLRIPGNVLTGRTIRRYEAFKECETYKVAVSEGDSQEFGNKYGIHILLKQADDGSVILGDSHVYADTTCQLPFDRREDIDVFMLEEAKKIYDLPNYQINRRWLGRYAQCKRGDIFTKTIDDRIHLVAGIGGKGMTAGPGFAQQHIQRIFDMNHGEHHIIPNVRDHYELVVFDMAGTVVEEDNLVYRTGREAMVRSGYAIDLEEVFANAAGMEKRMGIYNCLLALGVNREEAESEADTIHDDFKKHLWAAYESAEIKAKPGAEQLFLDLRSRGSKVALNTGYARPIAELLLKKLNWKEGTTVDALVTATDVPMGRPSSAMIDELRQRLSIMEPRAVAKIGDSTVDIEEGQNAGCGLVVGITTGAHTRNQLATAQPDLIVNELSEQGKYLKIL